VEDARLGSVVVDRYKILERLSQGAMGVVYRAERVQLGRIVAVKFLHSGFAASPDFIKRFELEARMMSRLDHPHCVGVIDFGVADAPFIVMDFVTGTTLKALVEDGPLPPARALAIVRQVLAGLAHAHEKGIIHRDIKPANVMLAQATGTGDHVRLLDFGLAKLHDTEQSASSNVVGTPSYMSPEQAAGKRVDGRSDLYATAVMLFELLTGEKPFQHDEAFQVIRMHVQEPPPSLREKRPKGRFSPQLEEVVRRGLAKSPDERFQTPEEFREACDSVPEAAGRAQTAPAVARAATVPAAAPRAVSVPPVERSLPPRRAPRGHGHGHGFLAYVGAAAILVGSIVVWLALGRPGFSSKSAAVAADARPAADVAREDEIRKLHDERRKNPRDASVHYRLGKAYVDKGWRAEALQAYLEAIDLDPARYKKDDRLIKDVIAALGDAKTRDNARGVLVKKIGAAALPQLRVAAKSKDPALRREATATIAELEKR
jgi:serine/threonine-protein kinase